MAHHHHHHHQLHDSSGKRLYLAIIINIGLAIFQIVGGLVSGSLALVADGVHNLSDAGSLVIAFVAKKVAGLPANPIMTFGYGRAEIIGALINSLLLVVVGVYLIYEALHRFGDTTPIAGWTVLIIASVALIVDLVTAWLTHKGSKESINMRAVFIHNLTDAVASVIVIISGILILLYQVYWVDLIATVLIAVYVIYHSWFLLKSCLRTLMQGVPEEVNLDEIKHTLGKATGVLDLHHIHVWQMHERFRSFEAHVVVDSLDPKRVEEIKLQLKHILLHDFKIRHSTLEFEFTKYTNCDHSE